MRTFGIRDVARSPALYPVTLVYVSAILALMLTSARCVALHTAVVGLGVASCLILLATVWHELHDVREVVQEQSELIEHLNTALTEGNISVSEAREGATDVRSHRSS